MIGQLIKWLGLIGRGGRACYNEGTSDREMSFQLRPHQSASNKRMEQYDKGQLLMPTGAGKTLTMIADAIRVYERNANATIVVVAPRILLAAQLSSEFLEHVMNASVLHVHSGDIHHFSTTKVNQIKLWDKFVKGRKIIFTTYNSLNRIQESGIDVHTIYFDEAHNSVKRNFFGATEHFSAESKRCYFFTATPKHSATISKPGMNDPHVYGQVIAKVPAPLLVDQGYILPPKVVVKQLEMVQDRQMVAERDASNMLDTIDEHNLNKILICARTTKQIIALMTDSSFCEDLNERGYNWMVITSKTGPIINGKKVSRQEFFDKLNGWGKQKNKKFVVIHHSILSEGINVSGLEAVLFMRKMDYIGISQTIGRVIRLGGPEKKFGLVCVPVYDKVGIATAKSVQNVVDTIFEQGEPAISVIKR